ncbi:MAG: DNA-binding protein [Rhizobiaceae bacterium]|nr:DNA-binding protein [Rhizobiaceae bacterium]
MAAFDFDAAVRWARLAPEATLSRRADDELSFVNDTTGSGQALLLDTCVYIDGLQGRAPDAVADLLDRRIVNHSTVAIQELMHTIGVLDPKHPGTASALAAIGGIIRAMPDHRIFTPDSDVLGRAALLSGILCRLQGYGRDAKLRALLDCTLCLQATKLGLCVLTANLADFDILSRMLPASRVLFYRPA